MLKLIVFIVLFVIINFWFNESGLFNKEGTIIFMAELLAFGSSAFVVVYPFKD